jgi:glucose-1-phosphate cytidylyltransferase
MKIYSTQGIDDFVVCLGYRGYVIKEYFANYFLHSSDVTFDMQENRMHIHKADVEPWKVTLVETGLDTQIGGRIGRFLPGQQINSRTQAAIGSASMMPSIAALRLLRRRE